MTAATSCRLWAATTLLMAYGFAPLVCAGGLFLVDSWRFAAAAFVWLAGLAFCLTRHMAAYMRVPPEVRARWK